MNADNGNIFFTEYDSQITGTSKRDPLGLQPIWSYYGRRVIKHLTTVSGDIRGFREVLLCLSICATAKELHNDISYQELILLFEQLFIYSAIEQDNAYDKEGIIGILRGTNRYYNEKHNPRISSNNTILVSQISLGYFGRYKTPLTTMGVIDSKGRVCSDITVSTLYGEKTYNEINKAFNNFVSSKNKVKTLNQFGERRLLYEAVNGAFRPREKQFWLEKLQVTGVNKSPLMAKCYQMVDPNKGYEQVLKDLDQCNYKEVSDIVKLEPFLLCMEHVFYQALNSKRIQDIDIQQSELDEYKARYAQFMTISDTKAANFQTLDTRLKFIREKCNPSSATYIKSIIEYHKLVSDQKRSAVWIEVDNAGNIQTFIQSDIGNINIEIWERNYYLSSLSSVKSGIERRTHGGK